MNKRYNLIHNINESSREKSVLHIYIYIYIRRDNYENKSWYKYIQNNVSYVTKNILLNSSYGTKQEK